MSPPRSPSESVSGAVVSRQDASPVQLTPAPRKVPSWRTTMLSPSPSPDRIAAREQLLKAQKSAVSVSPNSSSGSPPRQMVRASTASYRSPPPLPRLEIRDDTIQSPESGDGSQSSIQSKQQLPAVYQAQSQTAKDFYPTPISVGEMRWPAQSLFGDNRIGPVPAAPRPHSTGNSPDGHAPLLSGPTYVSPPTMARPQQPAYVHPGHPQPTYGMMRPRLSIHPYAPPAIAQGENRYWSAGGVPPQLGSTHERSYSSPSSALSPNTFKAPRKRADDIQLNVLNDVFDRTSYPSTEEREDLARQLGMTSRSVQIWFQNRRRAVKVEQQSAIQRAEADALARSRGVPAPYLAEPYMPGGPTGMRPSPASSNGSAPGQHPSARGISFGQGQGDGSSHGMPVDRGHPIVKREVQSPERDGRYQEKYN